MFVLSGPATVITNVATASVFPAEGWSTESVSRVVRTARTRQEKHEKERAEHAYYSHIHDEVTISDVFPATIQGLEEDENLPEDTTATTAQDDQEDETEQSLSDSLRTRRQISEIHENMGHPSNRTLVRVLRLDGAKRRFILAAAKHSCGACEAQKRPADPIVIVVGLDLFFHFACHENSVLAYWSAACHSPASSVGRNHEERIQKQLVAVIWNASHPCCRPAAQLVLRHFRRQS